MRVILFEIRDFFDSQDFGEPWQMIAEKGTL